jgi:hypothetical protein
VQWCCRNLTSDCRLIIYKSKQLNESCNWDQYLLISLFFSNLNATAANTLDVPITRNHNVLLLRSTILFTKIQHTVVLNKSHSRCTGSNANTIKYSSQRTRENWHTTRENWHTTKRVTLRTMNSEQIRENDFAHSPIHREIPSTSQYHENMASVRFPSHLYGAVWHLRPSSETRNN